jgi:hypothetical protein
MTEPQDPTAGEPEIPEEELNLQPGDGPRVRAALSYLGKLERKVDRELKQTAEAEPGRIPLTLEPGPLLNRRFEAFLDFVMPINDERSRAQRIQFELTWNHMLLEIIADMRRQGRELYKEAVKQKIVMPGSNGSSPFGH